MSDESRALSPEQEAIFSKHLKALHRLWDQYGWPPSEQVGITEENLVEAVRKGLVT